MERDNYVDRDSRVMNSLSIFTYNADEFLREVSKKGTSSDIEFHERKTDEVIMTMISPLRYPEKISSLTDSIYPADIAVVNVSTLNRELGEVLVALDLMGPENGFITHSETIDPSQLKQLTRGSRLDNYSITEKSPNELVEELSKMHSAKKSGETRVMIDHFFTVKSVGTVALGFVLQGTVSKHQDLELSYLKKKVQVKSIQMHDVDVEEAGPGSRVGLALKNIDSGDLERGMLLSEKPLDYIQSVEKDIISHRAIKTLPDGEFEVFISDCMRYQRASYDGKSLQLEKPFAVVQNRVSLSSIGVSPRVFGNISI